MTTTYTYSLSGDFGGNLNPAQLVEEIEASPSIAPTCLYINTAGDVVSIVFNAALSGGEQTTLDNIVTAHVAAYDTYIELLSAGTDGTKTTLQTTQTTDRVLTLPNATDTLVARASTDTLTNKILSSNTNSIIARELFVASGASSVSTYAATAPTAGQFLKATSSSVANWQNISSSDITSGTFTVSQGGTGATSFTSGNVLVGAGTSAIVATQAAPSGAFVGTTDTQTLTNKTLTSPVIGTIVNTGTLTLPISTDTLVGRATTDTLTNKTLTSPVIGTIVNTGTLTLPTSTTTLVGRSTTDTLTNKTFGDDLSMGGFKITSLGTPTADTDAATKAYADSIATGLDVKESVVAASDTDLDSNTSISGSITYTNNAGASGRGQITATLAVSDTFTLDGITFNAANNDSRILLKDETNGAANGIWTITISGTSLTLDRATDFDQDTEVTDNAFTFVELGTLYESTGWLMTTNNPVIIGGPSGTAQIWVQFSGAGQTVAGAGLTKTGNTIDVGGSTTIFAATDSIYVNSSSTANQILLSSGTVGTASTFGALPLGNSNAVTGTLIVANGGTGATSFTSGNILQGNGTGAITATLAAPTGAIVGTTDTQTLTNKTLTLPRINDTSADNQYIFAVSELAANRTVTLPLLAGNDEFTFNSHTQTLSNKTLTLPRINDTSADHQYIFAVSELAANRTITLPLLTGNDEFTFNAHAQTLTNKTISGASNTVTLDAASITSGTFADARISSSSVVQHEASLSLNNIGGTLNANKGGTGFSSYTTGDILYASGATALSKLAGVATGNALISGGVGAAPSWGKIGLTSHVSGTLPVANGGTGATSFTAGSWLQGNGTGAIIAIQNNMNANAPPTVNDDAGTGYSVGSRWFDTTNDQEYVCLDNTTTAAVWIVTTSSAGEANTASSAGGTSIFKNKVGVDLVFKGLTATSTKIALAANTNDVGIDVTEANLTLDNIGGTLSVAKGGTGATTLTSGNVLVGAGTSAVTTTKAAPTGDFVGTTDTQSLTNKTLTNTTNNITAKSLHSATTTVDVSLATAPTSGQYLRATSSTTATWQDLTISNSEAGASNLISTTSTSNVLMTDMTLTPAAGTYIAMFSSSGYRTTAGALISAVICIDTTEVSNSKRNIGDGLGAQFNNVFVPIASQATVAVNGSQAINVRWSVSAGTGYMQQRTLTVMRVS